MMLKEGGDTARHGALDCSDLLNMAKPQKIVGVEGLKFGCWRNEGRKEI